MKPVELELKNIGPFHHVTIDFNQLGDMFLVCGKTGAGKSTIFNSITYALYGRLPGDRSKVTGNELRSDFVAPHEEASITFTFLHHQTCYKIHRILPSFHLTKKNTETKKAESVELYKKNHTTFELIHNKKSETDNALENIMGLTVEEFSRIILLPQGEFAEFLKQNSKEKRETLLKLFPLDQYEKIIETIKEKVDAEKAQLRLIETQLLPYGDFDVEEQKEKIQEYEDILENITQKKETLRNKLILTDREITTLRNNLQEFDNYYAIYNDLNLHLQAEQEITAQEEKIARAIEATPAYNKITELNRITQSYEDITNQRAFTKNQIDELTAEANKLEEQKDYIKQLTETYDKNTTLFHDLDSGISLQQELDQLLSLKENKQKKKTDLINEQQTLDNEKNSLQDELNSLEPFSPQEFQDLNQRIVDNNTTIQQINFALGEIRRYNKLNASIKDKEKLIQEANNKSNTLMHKLQEKKQLLETVKEQNYAQLLAKNLQEGSPCPVCGSLHHPNLVNIRIENTEFSDFDYINEQNELTELETELNSLLLYISKEEGSLNELVQHFNLIECSSTEEDLSIQLSHLTKENDLINDRIKLLNNNSQQQQEIQSKLKQNLEAQSPLQNQIQQLDHEIASTTGIIQGKTQLLSNYLQTARDYGFTGKSISTIYSDVNNWLNETQSTIDQYKEKFSSIKEQLTAETARYQQLDEIFLKTQKELKQVESELNQHLAESIFSSQQQVVNAYLSQSSIQELQAQINDWKKLRTQLETKKLEKENKLTGTQEETRANLIQLEQQQKTLDNQSKELESAYDLARDESGNIKKALESWLKLESQRQQIQATATLISQLHTDISDQNPKRIAITTWILGVYLDQVVSCANTRLMRISDGRYTLLFSNDKSGNGAKGLDLEVLDSYTGKNRPCSTLSGGETFMVSISLALALTDVVTSKRGGISLQSLFIDEGFGSLDPASLDKALSILEEVREGRCVGVISHVSEMQNRIPTRLEVIKTSVGSTVKSITD